MRVRGMLVGSYVAIAASVAVVSVASVAGVRRSADTLRGHDWGTLVSLQGVRATANTVFEESFAYVLSGSAEEKEEFEREVVALRRGIEEVTRRNRQDEPNDSLEDRLTAQLVEAEGAAVANARLMFADFELHGHVDPASFDTYEASIHRVQAALVELIRVEEAEVAANHAAAIDVAHSSDVMLLLAGLLAIVVSALMAAYVARRVTGPLAKLRDAAEGLGRGELDRRIDVDSDDELGELAGALRKTADDLDRLIREKEREAERLEDVFQSIREMLFVTDLEGRITEANRLARERLGSGATELVGRPAGSVLGTRASFDAIRARVTSNGRGPVDLGERVLVARDGSTVHVRLSASVLRGSGSDADGIVFIAQDQTEQDAMRSRLDSIVDASPSLIYSLAVDGEVATPTWVSSNAPRLLGGDPEEMLRPEWWPEHLHPDERERVLAEMPRVFREGRLDHEYRIRHGDGSYLWVRDALRLVRYDEDGQGEIVGTWTDITERKEIELQFREAQKLEAIGRLAAGVAHDFNNLLTAIAGYTHLLLTDLDEDDPRRADVEEIRKAGARAADLTRQLLAFSRKQILQPRILDLGTVVAGTEKMLSRLIGEDVELITRTDAALGRVKADPGQIEQVILNMAVNARDAMPDGGRLVIETANETLGRADVRRFSEGADPGPYVALRVSDTGMGMNEETMSRLFEPFFTTKVQGKGTGLGLATVYGIVQQSGGHIEVQSAPGRGTTFTVHLPRADGSDVHEPYSSLPDTAPAGAETILLVEDEELLRDLAARVLRERGYRVIVARDGEEALRVLQEDDVPVDLLLTDVVMPHMGGRELADRGTRMRREMSVLLMTGYDEELARGAGIGGPEVMEKPFTPHALAVRVRAALDAERGAAACGQ